MVKYQFFSFLLQYYCPIKKKLIMNLMAMKEVMGASDKQITKIKELKKMGKKQRKIKYEKKGRLSNKNVFFNATKN